MSEDTYYEMCNDRIKQTIFNFIELDADILLHKDMLIDGVEAIDFSELDALENLAKLIETYSTNIESCLEVIEVRNIDLEIGIGVVNECITQHLKTHEDVEFSLEQPWKSSALRKLWKAITYYELKEMWNDGAIQLVASILEILLLTTDEDEHVPSVFE